MKRLGIKVLAIVVLASSLLVGCTDYSEHFRQNVILVSDSWNGAKLQNGDVITLDYYCEKAGVPTGLGWFDMVKKYEADVLFKR